MLLGVLFVWFVLGFGKVMQRGGTIDDGELTGFAAALLPPD